MTTIEAMTQDLRDNGTITGLRHWAKGNHERTYLVLAGESDRYAGCRSHQLYWDHVAGKLVNVRGKGMTTSAFEASLERVVAAFDASEA